MNIYPAVDILNGQAVRLRQGRKEDVTVYGQPVEMARRWFDAGAEWLHVVDLDGAFEGGPRNHAAIAAIAAAVPQLKIQVGGGMRNLAALDGVFEAGVRRASYPSRYSARTTSVFAPIRPTVLASTRNLLTSFHVAPQLFVGAFT